MFLPYSRLGTGLIFLPYSSEKRLMFLHATELRDSHSYGVATISRLFQIIRLFCKRAL